MTARGTKEEPPATDAHGSDGPVAGHRTFGDRVRVSGVGRLTQRSPEAFARWSLVALRAGPVLVLLVVFLAMTGLSPVFLTHRNITNLGVQASVVAILSLGQLLVMVARGVDLSVGATLALATVIGAEVYGVAGLAHGVPVIAAMLATGLVVGLVNGVVLTKGRIPQAVIVTLATLYVARGLALVISDGAPLPGMPPAINTLGQDSALGVPLPVISVACAAVLVAMLTQRMKWGRWIYATGGDPNAASRAGVSVDRVLISVYALCGLAAGFAGVLTAGRTSSGYPTAGDLAELDSIAACVIGGASLFGGRGTVVNALVGASILAVIRNGLDLLNVTPFWQEVAIGLIILAAVQLDVLRLGLEARLRVAAAKA
jgi:ribose transport system permease protein